MKIPNALRTAIKTRLRTDTRPMTSRQIADGVNPEVRPNHRKTARQMAFVLKQMERDGDLTIAKETKNGLTAHGFERSRVEYILNEAVDDPDIIEEEGE